MNREPIIAIGLAAVFTLLYFAATTQMARKQPLQVDEVFVMWIVHYFPGLRVMDALKMGLDSLPPAYYWLAQGCSSVLGQTPLAIRLPAICGFVLFPLSVFWLLYRRVDWRIAAAAMFFTTGSAAAWASTNGRPYAIVVGGFSLAAAAWVDLPQSRHRVFRCILMALGLAMGLAVHFLAVYEVAALAIAELLRFRSTRRIHWDCWIALAGGSATLLVWLPLIAPLYRSTHVSVHSPGFYAKPTLDKLFGYFLDILVGGGTQQLELVVIAILVPLMLAAPHYAARGPVAAPARSCESRVGNWLDLDMLAVAALSLPIITYFASVWVVGSFNERYFIAAALGVTLLLARGLHALRRGTTIALAVLLVSAIQLANSGIRPQPADPRVTLVEKAPEPLPVLVASASDFFFLSKALPAEKRNQISFAGMPSGFSSPDTEPDIIAGRWKSAVPSMPIYSWDRWAQNNRVFYVLSSTDPREGLTNWLATHEGATLVLHDGQCWLFKVVQGQAANSAAAPHA